MIPTRTEILALLPEEDTIIASLSDVEKIELYKRAQDIAYDTNCLRSYGIDAITPDPASLRIAAICELNYAKNFYSRRV